MSRFVAVSWAIIVLLVVLLVLGLILGAPWEQHPDKPEDCKGQVFLDEWGDYRGCLLP